MLPALLAAALLVVDTPARRPVDVVLRVDAPRSVRAGFRPPFRVELAFAVENGGGVVTFSGQCPWEDPARSLTRRWKAGLLLDPASRARALRNLRYVVRDADGRTVLAHVPRDPAGRVRAEPLSGLVFHLTVGDLGDPGAAVTHQIELEW